MTAQYIGCTIYFHSSKRYSAIQFAPKYSWNVSSFCGLHQPSPVGTGMAGATVGRAMGAAAAGVRVMGLAAKGTAANMSFALSAAVLST